MKNKCVLLILDGYGYKKEIYGNAINQANKPNLDFLFNNYPFTTLDASGEAVGLTKGQMGNSEVGHLNIGGGRVVMQDLLRIDNSIQNDTFSKNENLIKVFNFTKTNNSTLHLMGLCSPGGVHSKLTHLYEIVKSAKNFGINKILIHMFSDGRDTLKNSAVEYAKEIQEFLDKVGVGKIASVSGRLYAMDRENRWDRIKKTYDLLIFGKAEKTFDNAVMAIEDSYKNDIFDEFIIPVKTKDFKPISENDSVIFFNYRTDRPKELTKAITNQNNFNEFETKKFTNLCYATMTEYDENFKDLIILYAPEKLKNTLSEWLSINGKKQYKVTETTKYAHITYFFNGGIEKPFANETRELIESINEKNFALVPHMRAEEIKDKILDAINSDNYDFILANFSNPDMVGHTGDFNATVTAIEKIDKCMGEIYLLCKEKGYNLIITADHGNADYMLNEKGEVVTSHSTSKVPFNLISEEYKNVTLNEGSLSNVAPTVLEVMKLDKPQEFTNSLIKK